MKIRQLFRKHPSAVCMTYASHWKHSMALSGWFAWASFQALVHAFFPFWFVTSSTDNARRITHFIKSSGCTIPSSSTSESEKTQRTN